MAENWSPIFRVRTDGPVSIMFNATLRDEGRVPDTDRPSATMIAVAFREPGEHGMGEAADSEAIDSVMDSLAPRLELEAGAAYAGRVRGGGEARMWVYSTPEERERIERMARDAYAGREGQIQHRDRSEWDMYFAMSPSPREERIVPD